MSEPLIALRGLRKRFGRHAALAGIDLTITEHQIVAIVGPDGAGKTTLLRALAGLLDVEAECARVLGHDLRADVTALKERIGYVPQNFGLHRELTVAENLAFTARLHRIPIEAARTRGETLLERTALAPFADRPAGALSGGMKQKLAIANALLPEPALLLLDEPTAGVDITSRREMWATLVEASDAALVMLSTSYLDEAADADWVVSLDGGRIAASGPPAELQDRTPKDLYRLWSRDVIAAAHAARALPWVTSARAIGRYARVEVRRSDAPADAAARLATLPGAAIHLVEARAPDMECMLRYFAGGDAP